MKHEPRMRRPRAKHRPAALWLASLLVYAFLYLPLLILVLFSFNDSRLSASWVGFTWHWYDTLLHDRDMLEAATHSLSIALTASTGSTALGTLAAIAIQHHQVRVLLPLALVPVAIPEVLLGVALLLFFISIWGPQSLGLITVIIAHITFCIGFVTVVVRVRLQGLDPAIFEAARDLGASPWLAFRLITWPLITPAVIAGFLMSFALSIDDFVITFFTSGAGVKTLPLNIYTMIKVAVTPEVNAVSTLMMALSFCLAVIASRLSPNLFRGQP